MGWSSCVSRTVGVANSSSRRRRTSRSSSAARAPECEAGKTSRAKITEVLDQTARAIGARPASIEAWLGPLYQTANRLAHLHFLRANLSGHDAWLIHVLFEDDASYRPTTRSISARSVQRGGGLGGCRWPKVDERWGLCEGTGMARAPRCGCEVVTAGRRSPTAGAALALLPIPSRSDVAKLTEAGAQRLSHSRTRGIQTGAHSRRQEFSSGSAAATSGSCDLAPSAATDRKPTAAALSGFSIFMLSCARRRDSISAWIAHRAGTRTGWGVGSAWNAGLHWRRRVRHAGRPPGRTIASAQPVGRPSAAVLPRHSRPPPGR
jgi:hypothetical protein